MAKVTIIPASINKTAPSRFNSINKRRVAAYARVSTDSDEQFSSFEAQKDYYTKYIQANPNWAFAGIYADEGITGTNTKNRESFKKMILDALEGKIDLIVTKSVSRFARNTVDSLSTIRKLAEKGVEVFFEKENIYTLDSKGELLLTIMSSLAQEESRSISQNVTWGKRKSFADGNVSLPYSRFLGYRKGADGRPEVVPEEAEIVRLIFRLFFEGMSLKQIASYLEGHGIETKSKSKKWSHSTIQSILTNEKYKGEAILQKTYTTSFLTHEKKKNNGDVPQYHVKDSHEAIIAPEEWDLVQLEMQRRLKSGKSYSCNSIFSNRIYCADCHSLYGLKVWHSTDKYRTEIWQCNSKFKNEEKCKTPHLTEEQIKTAFIKAYNKLGNQKEKVIDDCNFILQELTDTTSIDSEIASFNDEIEIINGLVDKLVKDNTSALQSQEEYKAKYEKLEERYNSAIKRQKELEAQKHRKESQAIAIKLFMDSYAKEPVLVKEWNPRLWMMTIHKAEVSRDKKITFTFNSNTRIEVELN